MRDPSLVADDLLERLRSFADFAEWAGGPVSLLREAATRIADLTAERVAETKARIGDAQRYSEENARLQKRLAAAERVMEAFEAERDAGRFSCECEWAPDEYTTLVRRCVTHQALDDYRESYRRADRS